MWKCTSKTIQPGDGCVRVYVRMDWIAEPGSPLQHGTIEFSVLQKHDMYTEGELYDAPPTVEIGQASKTRVALGLTGNLPAGSLVGELEEGSV